MKGTAKGIDMAQLLYDTRVMAKRQVKFMKTVEQQFEAICSRMNITKPNEYY